MPESKKIEVDDFVAQATSDFIVKIFDEEENPITNVKFKVAIDNGDENTVETDEDGAFGIAQPENEVSISLDKADTQEGSS